ncbi:MAG: sugar phosphate isomerase/epimerase family protein [Trueperaceae bacterium]
MSIGKTVSKTIRLGIEAGSHTFDVAVKHGIKGVPIYSDQLVKDGVEKTLAPLKERGLEVCQIGAFGYNPLSTDEAEQARQTNALEQIIPMANDTGCSYIVICGGNYHPSGFGAADLRNFEAASLDKIAKKLEPLLKLAEKHDVKISIEAYLKTAINSPESFLTLWQKLSSDALRVNVDVTSLYDVRDVWNAQQSVEKTCRGLAGHYGLGHIKDVALAEGFHVHMGLGPLGSSNTDWSQVLSLMAPNMPDDSWLILEHVSTLEEADSSLGILRDAAEKAGIVLS